MTLVSPELFVLLSREKYSIYTEIQTKNFLESFHTLSLSFMLASFHSFLPFLFVLTLEVDGFSFPFLKQHGV